MRPRFRAISIFFVLAMTIQLGYYFDLLEFREAEPSSPFEFYSVPFNESPPSHTALKTMCSKIKWRPDVYINCTDITMSAFDAINQLQACIRWALDGGAGLVKPVFHSRSNGSLSIEYLLNESYLWEELNLNCPDFKVRESSELVNAVSIPGDKYFDGKYYRKTGYNKYLQTKLYSNAVSPGTIRVIQEVDTTRGWVRSRDFPQNQIAFRHLFRFSRPLDTIASRILGRLPTIFYAVHLVADPPQLKPDRDVIGELLEAVLSVNTSAHPVVYVACDDARELVTFTHRAEAMQVVPMSKWVVPSVDADWMTKSLTVDQMQVVDNLVMQKAYYFFGSASHPASFMLGQTRHFIQFGKIDYHGIDKQQRLLGPGLQTWNGKTW